MRKYVAWLAAVFILCTACASRPDYVRADTASAHGYFSTPLGTNKYRVTYNGDTRMGRNSVTDYALLRAAELTSEQGMDWFRVVEQATNTVAKPAATGGIEQRSGPVVERDCGLLGCSTTVRPSSGMTSSPATGTARTTYSVSLEIVMGNNPMPGGEGRYYNAADLIAQLWEAM